MLSLGEGRIGESDGGPKNTQITPPQLPLHHIICPSLSVGRGDGRMWNLVMPWERSTSQRTSGLWPEGIGRVGCIDICK